MPALLRLLGYLRPYRARVALVLGCMIAATGLNLLIPHVIQTVVDGLEAGTTEPVRLTLFGALGVIGITAVRGLFQFFQVSTAGRIGQRCLFEIRNDLYQHIQTLPFSFYDRAQTGQLMSRVTADVESLRMFMTWGMANLITHSFTILTISMVTFSMNWRLALLSMGTVPFLVLATVRLARVVRPAHRQVQEQVAEINTVLQENLAGIRVVKAFGREPEERRKFAAVNQGFLDKNLDLVRLRALYSPALDFIAGVGTVGIIWYGGTLVATGQLTLGTLIAFNTYLLMLMMPIRMMGFMVNQLQQAAAAGARIFEVMDTTSEIKEPNDPIVLPEVQGHVRFEGVTFSYGDGRPIVRGVDLDVPPKTTVALMGGAGSGKSTLINLLPRFYDVTDGRITIDGHDVRDFSIQNLRGHIGLVSQDPFLFSLSIRDNIAYGREDATQEEIEAAAKAAQIHDFIMTLPQGYDTLVGERGIGLSGGQKQRIAIARALLVDPAILILDDSTSAVDTQTEHRIQEALRTVLRGRTSLVIAHRLSTVKLADLVVVLDEGRIVQQGTHAELLAVDGPYRTIYETQLAEQEDQAERAL